MSSVKGPTAPEFRGRHAISAPNNLEQIEKVTYSEGEDKIKNEVYSESQEETNAARRIPSRRRLSSGGLLRKSQQKHGKRPSLFRSYTSDALFPSRQKKMASTGCDNVAFNGESRAAELQRQDSRDRRHSTPISIAPLQSDLVWKSEINQDAEVFADQVDAQQIAKLPVQKANTRTSVKSNGDNHDFSESSNVSGMKSDRDTRDRRAKSLPVNAGVHDLPCLTHSTSEKPSEIQQASHDIFRRHTQYRNPIKRDKQIREQSLPVLLNTAALRKEFENELKSQENFPKDHKFDSCTNLTEKVDTNSKSTLREDKKSPRTTLLKGFKSSLLERFLEQKEVDEVDFNEQRDGINQEKINSYQKSGTKCRRFSLPSRLEEFYGGDDKKGESSLNDELFSGTINNCQDHKADLGNVCQNKTDTTQQDFKCKKSIKVRAKSLPHVFTNFFRKIESGYSQKKLLPSNSDSPRRTKSLPKLTKLNDINMEGGYESKCDYTSAENSLNIEYSTQEVDGDTLEQFNQLGMFSATRSNSLPLDIDKSINTSTTLTSDLDDEIQKITKCVESVIQEFYKHKEQTCEQCGQGSVSHSEEELRHVKTCKCADSLPLSLNTKDGMSTDTENLGKGKQIGLETLPTTAKDLEIYSQILISPGEMGQDITHECADKIVVTEIERSQKAPASQEGSVSLEQTKNYICDCATKVNDSSPVEFHESGDKSEKLLLSDDMTAEMEQEIHTEATEQRNEESSETKPCVGATEYTAAFNTEFILPKNKEDQTLMENTSILEIFEERESVLQGELPDFGEINDCFIQDQLSIENNRVEGMENILSNEKSESKNLIFIRDDGANKFLCVTKKLISKQTSAAASRVNENLLEEFPQFLEDEITSDRAEVQKRTEEKSNYVENPREILHDVIQSVLEELLCQVETLNNKTDAIIECSSSVTVDKGLIESSSSERELEKSSDKNDDAQRGLSSNATKFQDDIFETSPSSGNIDGSASLPPDVSIAMIIPKQTEELQEKTSDLENKENKESKEKELSQNDILLSFENDEELDSESLDYPKETDSEEFENEVEEILEKVNDRSETVDGKTSGNAAKVSPPLSEDNFTALVLDESVRADIHLVELDKARGRDFIRPVENGETEKFFSQAEKRKVTSETLQPKLDVDDSFESCHMLAEHEQQSSEGDLPQQDHEILPGNLVNATDELHKSVITESASDSEVERLEIKQDIQMSIELKTAITENSADALQVPAVTEHFDLHLDEKKNCERVDEESPAERSHETVATKVSSNPETMKLDKKENIKTVKNDSSLSEKSIETSQEKLNDSAPSIEAMQLPDIILPCEEIETIPEALNAKPENKENEVVTMEQENKELLGEHAEMNEIGKLSDNLREESNDRKNLKLELKEFNSESVDICDHGSPIDKLSQELDAFDIPPFSRPRVYTLPLTHRMEKIVEAPCEMSPDIESKDFPYAFPRGLPSDILQLRRTESLCRDAKKGKSEKTKRSFSAPSAMLHRKSGEHDLYPVQEEPEAPEISFEDRMELFEKLLSNSLETILEPDFTRSKSPLHRAIAKERFDCVEFLIECGVDINANDESGWPPLHVAVTSGCFDCAVLLVEAGADLGGYTDLVMHEYKRLRRQVYCRTL